MWHFNTANHLRKSYMLFIDCMSTIFLYNCVPLYLHIYFPLRHVAQVSDMVFAYVKYLQKNKCESSSLKKVNNCPKSNVALQDRSQNLKCDVYPECQGEPLVYHCVKFDGYLVEVCSPKSPIVGM